MTLARHLLTLLLAAALFSVLTWSQPGSPDSTRAQGSVTLPNGVSGGAQRPILVSMYRPSAASQRDFGMGGLLDVPEPTSKPPLEVVMPVRNYRISAVFKQAGPHTGGIHGGMDFAAPQGTPIHSVCAGRVVRAEFLGNAGNAVVVRVRGGKELLYGHMVRILTKVGQKVKPGDLLGKVGSTGNSTGPHLHLQVNRPDGRLQDPAAFLREEIPAIKQMGNPKKRRAAIAEQQARAQQRAEAKLRLARMESQHYRSGV